jgi:hypothetical protein
MFETSIDSIVIGAYKDVMVVYASAWGSFGIIGFCLRNYDRILVLLIFLIRGLLVMVISVLTEWKKKKK